MTGGLTDAHTHLDHADDPVEDLIARAREERVDLIIQSGTDAESSRAAVALAERFPEVWATVGAHPHDADRTGEGDLEVLAELSGHPRVLAVGETGLDFYRDYSDRRSQDAVFRGQLEIARDAGLPVVIHTRAADEDSLGILAREADGLTVVLHCFSMPERLEEVAERGYFISLAGNVTYKSAVDLQQAAARVPDGLLLLETDAPWLTPVPRRGRPNEPALVRHVYEFVAGLRGVTVEGLASLVRANARRAFPRLEAALDAGRAP